MVGIVNNSAERNKILGYDVKAILYIGDPDDRIKLDISDTIDNLSYSFSNYLLTPMLCIDYTVNAYYINMLSNPYELELQIIEKSESDVPRSKIDGKFVCIPDEIPISILSETSSDTARYQIEATFFPKDISSTLMTQTSLVFNNVNVETAFQKAFKSSAVGSAKLKLGTIRNKKTYSQILLPLNRLQNHLVNISESYGFTNTVPIMYADFKNIYIQSINDTLIGESTPITIFYAKEAKDSDNINNFKYYTRVAPSIESSSGIIQNSYSNDIVTIQHPNTGYFEENSINLKKQLKNSKATHKTKTFDYLDLYKKSNSTFISGNDTDMAVRSKVSLKTQNSFLVSVTLTDPIILTDFVIGRNVKFDTSIRDFFGFDMSGFISSYGIELNSYKGKRWVATVELDISCVSNGAVIK